MSPPPDRRLRRLSALGLIAVVALGGLALGESREPAASRAAPSAPERHDAARPRWPALDQLRPSRTTDVPTDVFAGRSWQPPKPPPAPAAVVPPAPPAPPAAPALPFVYLGKWAEEGQGPVFYLEQGRKLVTARAGEMLDAQYRFDGLQAGELVFTYLPMNLRQTIRIGE